MNLTLLPTEIRKIPTFAQKLTMNLTLEGKNALVGGGSAGIGLAAAIELSKLGATVTLISRTEFALKEAVSLLDCSLAQQHGYIVADYEQPELLIESVQSELSGSVFHILVNNTGGPAGGPLINASTSDFTRAINNHLLCNHLLVQKLVPGMKQEGYGRIINVISTSVKEPIEGLGVSNTTRWAVAGWAKTLAGELGQYGITVNNVLPGYTNTSRLEEIIVKRVSVSGLARESVVQNMLNSVPARRFAEPAEVAAAVAFLATPAASYINGINLPVDGGRTKSI